MRKTRGVGIARVIIIAASIAVLGESGSSALAALPTAPGLWCERGPEHPVSAEHERLLLLSLRRISGLAEIGFFPDGSLNLGDISAVNGGATAVRQILIRVMYSDMTFIIEDHSGSDSVNFGQISGETMCESTEGKCSEVWRVRLDFKDFQQMEASSKIRLSFDEGFTLLHELLHGLGYKDASREPEIGGCEEIVNRARAELGLQLRDEYFGKPLRITQKITLVRLRFRCQSRVANRSRWESDYLSFPLSEPPEASRDIRSVARVHKPSEQRHRVD